MSLGSRSWVLIVLLFAVAAYVHLLSDVQAVPLRKPLSSVPLVLGTWRGHPLTMEDSIVENVGVEDYIFRDYRGVEGPAVNAYVGFYEAQAEGDTAHSPKHCLPSSGWTPIQSDEIEFETPGFNGGRTRANRYVIAKGDQLQLVLYWYQGRGRQITNEYAAKVYLVLDSIFKKRNDGALIRLMTYVRRDLGLEEAQARTVAFANLFLPEVGSALPED
jgi:EpsI family protein